MEPGVTSAGLVTSQYQPLRPRTGSWTSATEYQRLHPAAAKYGTE